MSNKLAMFDKLKNTMQEVEWHSTFDFESYEINAEDKAFIEKKRNLFQIVLRDIVLPNMISVWHLWKLK